MVEVIFELQMADGGWNCRIRNYPNTTHSSFHTTFNVLVMIWVGSPWWVSWVTRKPQSRKPVHRLVLSQQDDSYALQLPWLPRSIPQLSVSLTLGGNESGVCPTYFPPSSQAPLII